MNCFENYRLIRMNFLLQVRASWVKNEEVPKFLVKTMQISTLQKMTHEIVTLILSFTKNNKNPTRNTQLILHTFQLIRIQKEYELEAISVALKINALSLEKRGKTGDGCAAGDYN